MRTLTAYTHARAGGSAGDDGTAGASGGVRLVLGYAHLSPARVNEGVRLMREAVGG